MAESNLAYLVKNASGQCGLSAGALVTSDATGATFSQGKKLSKGNVAILKLSAAAELIEADRWQQYAELGGVSKTEFRPPIRLRYKTLDGDASPYIRSNTLDEQSHADFLGHGARIFFEMLLLPKIRERSCLKDCFNPCICC